MDKHADVLLVDGQEAMVKRDLTLVSERPLSFYLRVPQAWIASGRVPASYQWSLDWEKLRTGATMPPTNDRVHENRVKRCKQNQHGNRGGTQV